jgi:hypothetical protein
MRIFAPDACVVTVSCRLLIADWVKTLSSPANTELNKIVREEQAERPMKSGCCWKVGAKLCGKQLQAQITPPLLF